MPPTREDIGSGLFWVTLRLARATDFPNGSSLRGYHMLAPLDEKGHLDPLRWLRQRDGCPVLRFWAGEPLLVGSLRHRAGGRGGATWIIDYDPGAVHDEEADCRLDGHVMEAGEHVTLRGPDGVSIFRITGVSTRMPAGVRRQLLSSGQALPASPHRRAAERRVRPPPHAATASS